MVAFAHRWVLCAGALGCVLLGTIAKADLVVDIGGPGLGNNLTITPDGTLTIDVTITSTTGLDTLVEFYPNFMLLPVSTSSTPRPIIEFAPTADQPTGFVNDPAADYVFANDSTDYEAISFRLRSHPFKSTALAGFTPADRSVEFYASPEDARTGGTLIDTNFLVTQIEIVHNLDGFLAADGMGEPFQLTIADFTPTGSDGITEQGFIGFDETAIRYTSNILTITAVPEPSAWALAGVALLSGVVVGAVRRTRRRAVGPGSCGRPQC